MIPRYFTNTDFNSRFFTEYKHLYVRVEKEGFWEIQTDGTKRFCFFTDYGNAWSSVGVFENFVARGWWKELKEEELLEFRAEAALALG